MKKLLLMALALSVTPALAGNRDNIDPAANIRVNNKLVLVPEVVLPSGAVIRAFPRAGDRIGYTWVEGEFDEQGRFYPGYWNPLHREVRAGGEMVWVPGYQERGEWIPGYWRIPERPGFTWLEGYYDEEGVWHQGRWERISLYPPEKNPHPPHSQEWSAWLP